ncbi:YdcF family protein [Candidatus Peregrinibacteria bacterium CG_4_9_14_0_2_um_filter_53_11]|nr:MAG: YdcF family protein [Candidatus Peregrinibacteria bacterium CG_4_9_14_0_2_um_filter_53_11]
MRRIVILTATLGGLVLGGIFYLTIAIYSMAALDRAAPADAITVLGAAQYDGRPSPVLEARLEHALALYNKGLAPLIITTGGKIEGDRFTEAEAGKTYLVEHGIPESAILMDQDSLTTKQNLSRVKEIMNENRLVSTIIVSDPFHIYRATLIASDLGLTALPSPTRTSPIAENRWLEFEFVMREVFLTISHLLFEA